MSEPSWVGRKLNDRYEIEDLLGAGGMSSVFRANDPNLRRAVAIKLIHPHLSSDPQFVSRFEEEAVSVAQLRHPNIIQVHDFSHDGDTYYMVLEFVPGETLEERMKRVSTSGRQFSTKEAVEIIASICDALEYAHKRGMFHRDIKPANIMLNLQGQSILMDFGIAKIVGGKQHTATGAVVGTALYMAPEIIRGEMADHRVDIYSLGITLFEILTGKRPFEADSAMTTLMMHVNDPVPDASEINPDVPSSLVDIVVKSMAKDKAQRYQSAAEFATALRTADLSAKPKASVTPAAGLAGTMVEDAPLVESAGIAGTTIEEAPPVESLNIAGTMIEDAPPAEALNIAGTMVEDVPASVSQPQAVKPSSPPPPVKPPTAKTKDSKGGSPFKWIGIGGIGILLIAVLAFFGLRGTKPPEPTATPTIEIVATLEPTATLEPAATMLPTATLEPTVIPTATLPPGPQVRMTSIILDGSTYVVEYETFEYTEALPGMHVHFYFNNFTQSQVGAGGGGNWKVYGGPRPFSLYTTSNRPADATQMCAIVANSNHTIILDTGNCLDLP
ncbi:MAG: serine/threonine protein kinase [Anaerolineae bacterium]|jgi:serine/threonine protein kinase|nr:serine/threonine protein kinase [Anaerolineae bacterium]MBT7072110.1 serine/threonine protein kinase [Anaerolineae bacterium]MBT7326759.1 serine/threonine protein kinase [Anaerolineae bacterium]